MWAYAMRRIWVCHLSAVCLILREKPYNAIADRLDRRIRLLENTKGNNRSRRHVILEMIGKQSTFRLLMSMYMALMIPLCCCFSSAWAETCCAPEQAQLPSHVEQPHDHGHHDHDEKHPDGNHDNGKPIPSHEHDGSCDCGCDSSMDRTTPVKASEDLIWSVFAVQLLPHKVLQLTCCFQDLSFRQRAIQPSCNSLLCQHCAQIV